MQLWCNVAGSAELVSHLSAQAVLMFVQRLHSAKINFFVSLGWWSIERTLILMTDVKCTQLSKINCCPTLGSDWSHIVNSSTWPVHDIKCVGAKCPLLMLITFFTHVFSFPRYILTFRNSLDPASLLKTKRRRIRTQRSQDCLPSENIYRRQKHQPHPKTPRHLPLGCRPFDDCLSRWTLQETETFEEGEEDLKPSFTFWRARSPAVSWFSSSV